MNLLTTIYEFFSLNSDLILSFFPVTAGIYKGLNPINNKLQFKKLLTFNGSGPNTQEIKIIETSNNVFIGVGSSGIDILIADTVVDMEALPTEDLRLGTLCYIIDDETYYSWDGAEWNLTNDPNANPSNILITEITKFDLDDLRTNNQLYIHTIYRITDATTSESVIDVMATSNSVLSTLAFNRTTDEYGTYDLSTDTFTATSGGNASITTITAAALLALPSFSTTTIYVVTDAPFRIAIQAETTSQLGQTGTIVDDVYAGTVHYDLATNTFLNGTIYDGDGNTWNGVLPSGTTLGASSSANVFLTAGTNTFGASARRNIIKQGVTGFILGDFFQNTTIEADIAGANYTASPDYDFLYGNAYSSKIVYDGTNNYHLVDDPANDRIVVTLMVAPFTVSYIGGATPDLQQVLDAGDTSTTPMIIDDGAGNSVTISTDLIKFINTIGGTAQIKSSALASNTVFEIPNKAASPQTFAMLSDVVANPMTTGGDIIYGGASGVPTRLANGTAGQVLQSNGTTLAPSWAAAGGGGDAYLANDQTFTGENTFVIGSGNDTPVTITKGGNNAGLKVTKSSGSGDAIEVAEGSVSIADETASTIAHFDGSKRIKSLATSTYPSLTELALVKGVGSQVVGTTDTNILTNKRITARTGTVASDATPTINTDNVDFFSITAQTVDITSFTTNLSGTPTDGQTLWIAITGTAARAITWGASFEASTIALPTTTVTTARLDVAFIWNAVTSKWRCVGVA
jgi:hypothetical protein